MSADFWGSSQRNVWQMSKFSLLESRRKLLLLERKMIQNGFIKDYPQVTYDPNMRIYLHNLLIKLGRRLNIRQIALATAEIFLTRFLIKVSLKEVNAYLLVTTCLYTACKIEECPQHIRLITSEARNLWPEYIPHDITKLAEFEFYLVEELDSYLLLYHPYSSLIQIRDYLSKHMATYGLSLTDEELQSSWSLINDSYITDLHIYSPPHIIAIASIYIALILKKNLTSIRGNDSPSVSGPPLSIASAAFGRPENDNMQIEDLMLLASGSSTLSANLNVQQNQETMGSTGFQDSKLDQETMKIEKFMNFLTRSHVNLDQVSEAIQEIINLYFFWSRYNEAIAKNALQNMLLNR